MASAISRRTLVAGAIGVAGTIGFGGFMAYDISDHIRRILNRLLGDFEISDADMAAFSRDFTKPIDLDGMTGLMLRAGGYTRTDGYWSAYGPRAVHDRFDGFARSVLGDFIKSTNYMEVYEAGSGQVIYLGLNTPCSNPFARFDLT